MFKSELTEHFIAALLRFDLLEWCPIIFRTEYTVSTITLALCLALSVFCVFCLWALQCNSVPTMRHHRDGLLHTYAWIRSVNNHLPICIPTIGTELMRGMWIHCAQALQCEEKLLRRDVLVSPLLLLRKFRAEVCMTWLPMHGINGIWDGMSAGHGQKN